MSPTFPTRSHITHDSKKFAYHYVRTEMNSTIHRQFRDAHQGHKPHAGLDPSRASTGVVWTTERAYEYGYLDNPNAWANLGQGAPEVSDGEFEVKPSQIHIVLM